MTKTYDLPEPQPQLGVPTTWEVDNGRGGLVITRRVHRPVRSGNEIHQITAQEVYDIVVSYDGAILKEVRSLTRAEASNAIGAALDALADLDAALSLEDQ